MEESLFNSKSILIVDDETDLRDILAGEFIHMGAHVFQAGNITSARNILEKQNIDLVVSDIRMPGGTGIDLLNIIRSKNVFSPPVILITGFADITLEDAFDKGAEALVSKPFNLDDLIGIVLKFLAPIEDRLTEVSEGIKKIQPEEVSFGRGGVTVTARMGDNSVLVGEMISFDFIHDGLSFIGNGICRWIKTKNESGLIMMGIEITYLESSSMNHFLKVTENRSVVSFIPSSEKLIS